VQGAIAAPSSPPAAHFQKRSWVVTKKIAKKLKKKIAKKNKRSHLKAPLPALRA
jgi:hypothetical protein